MKTNLARFVAGACLAITVFALFGAPSASAQRTALDTFAITNARIVTAAGADIERGTVVVRDGLITAVGANAQVPADARVIDGAGLTVYPGFFDAATTLGIPAAQPARPAAGGGQAAAFAALQQAQQQQQLQSNSLYPVGLQPEISAADLIRPSDSAFETARNNGFTTALVVPRERIFQGQSALINLAGDNAAQTIIRQPVALHVAFVSLQGGTFPTSLMGTFAALRQALLDAQRLQQLQQNYQKNPRGLRRPADDKSLEALFPVLSGAVPVVFQADTEREITRALNLAQEFKLKAMIAGGAESYKVTERLKTQNVPVLLSLNFPKRSAAASPEADPETMETLRYRVETPKTAAKLAIAKVRFAFQSGGLTNLADFWANANRAIEGGLGKGDALRAMTVYAADIFGVANQLGTIEPGKIANLTVTRGDVFDKSRTFTHVFVDGRMFEIKQAPARPERPGTGTATPGAPGQTPAAPAAGAPNLAGNWALNFQIGGQQLQANLNLAQQGNQLTGALETQQFGRGEITRGEITADGFRFVVRLNIGENADVVFEGRATGNEMSGTANAPQGSVPFSGTRTP